MVDEFDRGEDSIDVHCRSIVPLEESFEKSKKKRKYSKRSTNDDCDSISKVDSENRWKWMLYFSRIIETIYTYIFLRGKNVYIQGNIFL